MSLQNAVLALDALAAGQSPSLELALSGLQSLDLVLLKGNSDQGIRDAASTLELLVAGVAPSYLTPAGQARLKVMTDAIRKLIDHG